MKKKVIMLHGWSCHLRKVIKSQILNRKVWFLFASLIKLWLNLIILGPFNYNLWYLMTFPKLWLYTQMPTLIIFQHFPQDILTIFKSLICFPHNDPKMIFTTGAHTAAGQRKSFSNRSTIIALNYKKSKHMIMTRVC